MPLSTLTTVTGIAENSAATPGLFNSRLSVLDANIQQINNSAGSGDVFLASAQTFTGLKAFRGAQTQTNVIGAGASVSGTLAVVYGDRSRADTDGVAIGSIVTAGVAAVAEGKNANAAASSLARGKNANAAGIASIADGQDSYSKEAYAITSGYLADNRSAGGILIGQNSGASENEPGVVGIGQNIRLSGVSISGGWQVGVGKDIHISAWRGTGTGAKVYINSVSGTANGYGARVEASHGGAWGKGAWVPPGLTNAVVLGDVPGLDVYFGNGHTSRFVNFEDSAITGEPWKNPCTLHGTDARDVRAVPLSDVSAGAIRIMGGRPIGTGTPGGVEFWVAEPASGSTFTQQAALLTAKVDFSSTANSTRFWLYDVTDATLRQVMLGADDSGGAGFKMLRVAN